MNFNEWKRNVDRAFNQAKVEVSMPDYGGDLKNYKTYVEKSREEADKWVSRHIQKGSSDYDKAVNYFKQKCSEMIAIVNERVN